MTRLCSRCSTNPARPGQSYCGACHADYQREWRARRRRGPAVTEFSGKVTGVEGSTGGLVWVAAIGGTEVRFVSPRDDLLGRHLRVYVTLEP